MIKRIHGRGLNEENASLSLLRAHELYIQTNLNNNNNNDLFHQ